MTATDLPFQRARKPEEREIRREAILAAAAELFDAQGVQGAGLNAIAARAGFTKSNVYRYFESREEVLLSLFLDALESFIPDLEQRFSRIAPGDLGALADTATDCFERHPRLCSLTAILSSVLEQNISEAAVIALKRGLATLVRRAAAALQLKLPGANAEDCAWVVQMAGVLVAGIWPGAHPPPVSAKVLAMPEFAGMTPSLDRDLRRALRALLASIAPARGTA